MSDEKFVYHVTRTVTVTHEFEADAKDNHAEVQMDILKQANEFDWDSLPADTVDYVLDII